jgi:CRP-like cAMP-binding protein
MKLPEVFYQPDQVREFQPGELIFEAGTPGEEMFLVQTGEVDIQIGGRVVETVGPEHFFGELALIDDGPRSATAVARTPCRLVALNQRRFAFLVDEMPFFAINVMKVMADRLRRTAVADR